jgi:L-ascorbate metabolism protein UlaG (beta-lactamase superfamily)
LSHDHHFDNLDHAGRSIAAKAAVTYTTVAGAARLGGAAIGLAPWESVDLVAPDGVRLRLTATPARHGPVDGDRGPVIGFVLTRLAEPDRSIYLSGDTVWYDGVAEVGRRFKIETALLNLGAAMVAVAGPNHLTFTAAEAVELARAWPEATIVPLHFEGWTHFSEGREQISRVVEAAGLGSRIRWLEPGRPTTVP